jgi:hypothetical protein
MDESRVRFSGLKLLLAQGWCDVTGDLDPGVPGTLARSEESVGALQLSVARYSAGANRQITVEHLRGLLANMFSTRNFGARSNVVEWCNGGKYVRGDHRKEGDFHRIWYFSDGLNVALVTYTSIGVSEGDPRILRELTESETIVRSIEF